MTLQIANVVFGVLLVVSVLLMFRRDRRWFVEDWIDLNPNRLLILPLLLWAGYQIYCIFTGGTEPATFFGTLGYFFLPTLIMWYRRDQRSKGLTVQDMAVIAAFWIPFDFKWFGSRDGRLPGSLDYAYVALASVLLGLIFWACWRRIEGMKLTWPTQSFGYLIVLISAVCLASIIIPLGLVSGFLTLKPLLSADLFAQAAGIAGPFFTAGFWMIVGAIVLTTALPEELLFRGILQNLLTQKYQSRFIFCLLITSLCFGAAHLEDGATGLAPWNWNWLYASLAFIASLGYGLCFRYTRSLFYPILLHALVDAIWGTFFLKG